MVNAVISVYISLAIVIIFFLSCFIEERKILKYSIIMLIIFLLFILF